MSAANKRYSHSFSQTADTPSISQLEHNHATSSARADQAVSTSDGMFVLTCGIHLLFRY